MPRLKNKPPAYRLHKPSGRAVVTIDGRVHYLGKFDSTGSHENYNNLIKKWLDARVSTARKHTRHRCPSDDLRISELLVEYLEFAEQYYRKNGQPTGEYPNMKEAARPLLCDFETTRVCDFGPAALREVRDGMIEANLGRKVINARVNRIRRIFKWGVEYQLVDPAVVQALQCVSPLKAGRCNARETAPVTPVPQEHIDAVLSRVLGPVRATIKLQLVTGMRPGEVVIMRACDIDMSSAVWLLQPRRSRRRHAFRSYVGLFPARIVLEKGRVA